MQWRGRPIQSVSHSDSQLVHWWVQRNWFNRWWTWIHEEEGGTSLSPTCLATHKAVRGSFFQSANRKWFQGIPSSQEERQGKTDTMDWTRTKEQRCNEGHEAKREEWSIERIMFVVQSAHHHPDYRGTILTLVDMTKGVKCRQHSSLREFSSLKKGRKDK